MHKKKEKKKQTENTEKRREKVAAASSKQLTPNETKAICLSIETIIFYSDSKLHEFKGKNVAKSVVWYNGMAKKREANCYSLPDYKCLRCT